MTSIFPLLMFVIVFACVATCYAEGMWSNTVRLINIVTAALLATNFYEPVAQRLDTWQPSYTYLWDFLALWGLFGACLLVFRESTDRISRVKVRFLKVADRIGSGILSVWIGCVMVCFTMMTLHTAPLGREFLFGGFSSKPDERMLWVGPDQQWLDFTQKMSTGAFAGSGTPAAFTDDFRAKYSTRRKQLEKYIAEKDSLLVGP